MGLRAETVLEATVMVEFNVSERCKAVGLKVSSVADMLSVTSLKRSPGLRGAQPWKEEITHSVDEVT